MSATHRRGPTRMDEPAGTGRWLATLGRHPWYLAIMAVAAFGLVAGSVTVLVQANSTPSHQLAASNCGLVNCGAALPGPSSTISTQSQIGKAHTTVSHAPKPSASPTPAPAQAPTHAQASPPNVTLTFSAGQDQRDFDHFQGQLTLVNQGGSPVAGWTAELTLPGDEIFSVENQDGRDGFPFDHWQFDGNTLTISADNSNETLTPGQPLSLTIHGRGRTTSPTGCTFNGAACPTLRVQQQPQQQPQFQQPQQQTAPDQPSSQSAQSSSPQTSQAAPSSPQSAPSSPQDQQPSPQDQQPSQDGQQRHHQWGQRSWQDDRQPSFWGWGFSSWH
jgi:cellulose binding protein with CBM2 domain